MNNRTDKRNVIDYILIFVYIFMILISDDPTYRSYSLLAISILGILISIGILIFKKDLTKSQKTREIIAIVLLVLAASYAIYRLSVAVI